jgi:hypothetical protein
VHPRVAGEVDDLVRLDDDRVAARRFRMIPSEKKMASLA